MKPTKLNEIVLDNKFYPSGLTERMVWEHYQTYKSQIIDEIADRPIALFIYPEKNKMIVRRKYDNETFTLNKSNYDKLITGRTVSIAVELGNPSDYWILDIDRTIMKEIDLKNNVKLIKDTVLNSDKKLFAGYKLVNSASGYHIYLYTKKSMNLGEIKSNATAILKKEFFGTKILINKKSPSPGFINIDLSIFSDRGCHTVINSLCKNGLLCKDITDTFNNYSRKESIIK